MRELKEYSIKDNVSYLKEEYRQLYFSLVEMVNNSAKRFMEVREKVDDAGDFNTVLNTVKSAVPQGLVIKSENPKLIYSISKSNIMYLMDMFESMFLEVIDQNEFNALDPELQDLYFKAQKAIDKEEKDG